MFQLLVAHAIADFGLQPEWVIRRKMAGNGWCLYYHCLIHSGIVHLITGNELVAVITLITHLLIDYGKVKKLYNENLDQLLHLIVIVILTFFL